MYTQVCPNSLNFPTSESAKGSLLTKRQINVRFSFQVVQKTRYGILPMKYTFLHSVDTGHCLHSATLLKLVDVEGTPRDAERTLH